MDERRAHRHPGKEHLEGFLSQVSKQKAKSLGVLFSEFVRVFTYPQYDQRFWVMCQNFFVKKRSLHTHSESRTSAQIENVENV